MPPLSNFHRSQRLQAIAQEQDALPNAILTVLPPPREPPRFAVPDDERKANAILGQLQIENQIQRPSTRKSFLKAVKTAVKGSSQPAEWAYMELYLALTRVVEENGLPGVLEILLNRFIEIGGNINVTRKASDHIVRKSKQEERGFLLQQATKQRCLAFVQLLARHGDQDSLDESLQIAVQLKDEAIVGILLQWGANSSQCESAFSEAVDGNNLALLNTFLKAVHRVSTQCMSRGLLCAAANGNLAVIKLLVAAGAEGDYDNASALMCAVRTSRLDIAAAILVSKNRISGISIDKALGALLVYPQAMSNSDYGLAELLLCAGPIGNAVNDGLIKSVQMSNVRLLQLCLDHNIDINYNDGAALRHAIQHKRTDLVEMLLQDPMRILKSEIASELVLSIPSNVSSADRMITLSKLLERGATGNSCDEFLLVAVEQGDLSAVQLLVTHGKESGSPPVCSVNYKNARSLLRAVSLSNLPMLNLLVSDGQPTITSLSNAFDSMPPQLTDEARFAMAEMLLVAGAHGPGIDAELCLAVSHPNPSDRLVELLVRHGATVLYDTLMKVVSRALIQTLKVLLTGNVSPSTCSAAIPVAMKIHNFPARFHIMQLLLGRLASTGVESIEVSQAVITLIQTTPQDEQLLYLLCQDGKTNVNAFSGLAVELAVKLDTCSVLTIVLQSQGGSPSHATVSRGLTCAIGLPLVDKYRQKKVAILLQGVKPQQTLDMALIQEINFVKSATDDLGIIRVLLDAGADVNAEAGAALWGSITHPAIMDLVLSKRPNNQSLGKAFQQAMLLSEPARCVVCEKLWKAGVPGDVNSKSLLYLLRQETLSAIPLLKFLIPRSDVNFKDGLALRMAVQQAFVEAVDLILLTRPNVPSTATKVIAFAEAMNIQDPGSRLDVVRRLLAAGIPKSDISDGLIFAVNTADLALTCMFLKHGALVEHREGQAVLSATSLGNHTILNALVNGDYCAKPRMLILTRAFVTAMTLKHKAERNSYYKVVETLLAAGVRGDCCHIALIESVNEGDINIKLSELLYDNGASAEFNDGEAIYIATRSGSNKTLDLLLRNPLPEKILKEAYILVANLSNQHRYHVIERLLKAGKAKDRHVVNSLIHATRQSPPDRQLIKLLSSHDVYDEGDSMLHAATEQDLQSLSLLAESPRAALLISMIFDSVMLNESFWNSSKGLEIMLFLLEKGATGAPVSEALYRACEKSVTIFNSFATEFIDVLLYHSADVNYQYGRTLQYLTQQLNFDLTVKLLPHASAESKAMAIPLLFKATKDTSLSMQDGDKEIFANFQHPNPTSHLVLFRALENFPQKPQIFNVLLKIGYSANQYKSTICVEEVGLEPEPILCWALQQRNHISLAHKIPSISIENLIDWGANVNLRAKSGFTPLILAIQNQRPEIVEKLINKGANVKVPNKKGISPLTIASSLASKDIIESLLQANPNRDDGSLHDAARELRCDHIRLLIKYGHQPDYPSERHDGRSALAELCYRAVECRSNAVALQEAIECLVAHGADIWLRCISEENTSKTMLHYALDSSNPLAILTVLLKLLWKKVNGETFLYKDSKYTYSLTKYVEKDVFKGPQEQKEQILRLLRNKRIVDRYWANDIEADQPEDYCGAPSHIEDEVVRQKLRRKRNAELEQDAMVALDLKRIAAVGNIEMSNTQIAAEIRWADEKAKADLSRNKERASAQLLEVLSVSAS